MKNNKRLCPNMRNSLWLFSFLVVLLVARWGQAATVCTMTFSSPDEKEVLRKIYEPQGVKFVELVPSSRQDQWLENACKSQVQCDVLLISGHFGGLFFGETSGLSVSLPQLESASCRQDCQGIFERPKDVFLLGCNTLAGKKRDHRTLEQYVQVLVQDGFDRELAESVAITRYQQLGLSMYERFQSIFPRTSRIHGYSSTGPLGPLIAPALKRSFVGTSAQKFISEGAPVQKLKKELSAYSYVIANGLEASSDVKDHRRLSCQAEQWPSSGYAQLVDEVFFRKHYETIINSLNEKLSFRVNFRNWLAQDFTNKAIFENQLNQIYKESPSRLGLRLSIIDVKRNLGLYDFTQTLEAKRSALSLQLARSLKGGLDYQEAEQICSQSGKLQGVPVRDLFVNTGDNQRVVTQNYLYRIQQCLGVVNSLPMRTRDDVVKLQSFELKACLIQAQGRRDVGAGERDGMRWGCINSYEAQMKNLNECLIVYNQFENKGDSGFGWTCLKSFTQELNAEACREIAAGNSDVSNADDMIWNCWSKIQYNSNFKRSDCLGLSVGMQIYGNRLKMNWNCQNRVHQE